MPGGSSLGLSALRAHAPFPRSHHKNRSGGLLDGGSDDKYRLTSRRIPGLGGRWTRWRVLGYLVGAALLSVAFFFWRYQVHVEIQLFSRGWVNQAILPVRPLSSTCFDPSHIASTHYNTSLANAPSYVDVHAGMGMPLGRDCYDFAATLPRHPLPGMILPERTTFHTYWRSDLLQLGPRQISLLHSILATQDRTTTSVILWTNGPTSAFTSLPILTPLLALYGDRLVVRTVDKRALARGTPMEGHKFLEMADTQAWVDGDLVRVLVLYALGGIWVDFDTIMTGRDMRVLGESDWVTQWDCYDKVYQPLNGAMMHFHRKSPYLCEFLHSMASSPPPAKNSVDWGARLYHKVFRSLLARGIRPFKVLPYCFTDGVSCRLDNRLPDPFDEKKAEKKWGKGRWEDVQSKVENVWAVHLHNRWDKSFPPGGWVDEMILKPVMEKVERYRLEGG
ncbi:hypothetical protein JCM6882_006293 [Rhodosporidiobolus microsporus]